MTRLNAPSRPAAAIILSAVLFGCAHPQYKMVRDDYGRRASGIRSIGVLAPDVACYDVSFGGVRDKNDEQSRLADQNIVAAIRDVLSARGFSVKIIAREGERKESLDEIAGLFDTIAYSHRVHVVEAQPRNVFPLKAASFDYSVGPISDILDAEKVDALLLVEGGGIGASFFQPGGTVIVVGLVDRTGAILWYEPYLRRGNGFLNRNNLADADSVHGLMEAIFDKMPAVPR